MAARAGSVHLISSMDRKGGARPRPKQPHPLPQGPPFSIKCLLTTGSPQSIPIKTHSFLKAKTHTNTWRPFCHTAHARAHLISCVGGVTTRHRNHIRFKPSSVSVRPYRPLDRTAVQCLINRHGLTFDLLPRPQSLLAGFKGHHRIRDTPTYRRGQVLGADIQALAREATPNRKQ